MIIPCYDKISLPKNHVVFSNSYIPSMSFSKIQNESVFEWRFVSQKLCGVKSYNVYDSGRAGGALLFNSIMRFKWHVGPTGTSLLWFRRRPFLVKSYSCDSHLIPHFQVFDQDSGPFFFWINLLGAAHGTVPLSLMLIFCFLITLSSFKCWLLCTILNYLILILVSW